MHWVSKNRILRTHRTCCEKCLLITEYIHEEFLIALRFLNILHIDIFLAVLMPDIMHVKCSYVSSRGSKFFLIKGYGLNRIPDHSELASSVSDWIFLDTGNDTRKRVCYIFFSVMYMRILIGMKICKIFNPQFSLPIIMILLQTYSTPVTANNNCYFDFSYDVFD